MREPPGAFSAIPAATTAGRAQGCSGGVVGVKGIGVADGVEYREDGGDVDRHIPNAAPIVPASTARASEFSRPSPSARSSGASLAPTERPDRRAETTFHPLRSWGTKGFGADQARFTPLSSTLSSTSLALLIRAIRAVPSGPWRSG